MFVKERPQNRVRPDEISPKIRLVTTLLLDDIEVKK
jgi:hypothetical protein